jgi:hypothetical protein
MVDLLLVRRLQPVGGASSTVPLLEQWDRMEPVVQHLLNINDPDFMLNKVIEIQAPHRFSMRELPSQKCDGS